METCLLLKYSSHDLLLNKTKLGFSLYLTATFPIFAGFACSLELLAEPFYILAQYMFCLKLRMVVESAATLARCVTSYVLIVRKIDMVRCDGPRI